MDRTGLSRRRLLRYGAVGSVAGFGGCLGDDGNSDGENGGPSDGSDGTPTDDGLAEQFELAESGSDRFADWLAPEAAHPPGEDRETLYVYHNFEIAAEQGVQNIVNYRRSEAQAFGVDPESLSGQLLVGTPEEGREFGSIHLGTFDADSIVSTFESEGWTVTEEYEGYTVFDDRIAVGEDALVETPEYASFIDARTGDGPHLRDEYDSVETLLTLQPAGIQISASRRTSISDLRATASSFLSVDDDGNPDHIVRTFVFETADDASVERAEEIAAEGRYDRTLTGETHGRVVILEHEA